MICILLEEHVKYGNALKITLQRFRQTGIINTSLEHADKDF